MVGRMVGAAILIGSLLSCTPALQLSAQDSVPAGFGSLRRDDIVVRLATPQVELQVLPLEEQVIRLLAPDTYQSLRSLMQNRAAEIQDAARRAGVDEPTLVMVSFFGVVPQARFTPDDLNITSRGRLFRPVGIVPITPTWSSNQLGAREQAVAIYVFEPGIGFREQLTVSYQGRASDAWSRAVRALDRERTRALSRAQQTPPDTTKP